MAYLSYLDSNKTLTQHLSEKSSAVGLDFEKLIQTLVTFFFHSISLDTNQINMHL